MIKKDMFFMLTTAKWERSGTMIYENVTIPRFTLKNVREVDGVLVNRTMPYSEETIKKAVRNGMILTIKYVGDNSGGLETERTICPCLLGRAPNGNLLIRGYHLKGFSASKMSYVEKEWRLFKVVNIRDITFVGAFFRLPPEGYKMTDKLLDGGVVVRADFDEIRARQARLVKAGQAEPEEDVTATPNARLVYKVKAESTPFTLDLKNPWSNGIFRKVDARNVRLTFVKSLTSGDAFVLVGIFGKVGATINLYIDGTRKGSFKVVDAATASDLEPNKFIFGRSVWKMVMYQKK